MFFIKKNKIKKMQILFGNWIKVAGCKNKWKESKILWMRHQTYAHTGPPHFWDLDSLSL